VRQILHYEWVAVRAAGAEVWPFLRSNLKWEIPLLVGVAAAAPIVDAYFQNTPNAWRAIGIALAAGSSALVLAALVLFIIGLVAAPAKLHAAQERSIVGLQAQLAEEGEPPHDEVPDDQVIPAYLARLPGDQRQLLLSLNLGEKVWPLDEPGLESLEKNRLAKRLRHVERNRYLFRLHPTNAAHVKAMFDAAPPLILSPAASVADHFAKDRFGHQVFVIASEDTLIIDGRELNITTHKHFLFDVGAIFLSFLIPHSPDAVTASAAIADFCQEVLKRKTLTPASEMLGDEVITGDDLVFTGRIWIYHQDDLSVDQRGKLREFFHSKGLRLQMRGQSYAMARQTIRRRDEAERLLRGN